MTVKINIADQLIEFSYGNKFEQMFSETFLEILH